MIIIRYWNLRVRGVGALSVLPFAALKGDLGCEFSNAMIRIGLFTICAVIIACKLSLQSHHCSVRKLILTCCTEVTAVCSMGIIVVGVVLTILLVLILLLPPPAPPPPHYNRTVIMNIVIAVFSSSRSSPSPLKLSSSPPSS